jgi:hypothetical protein
MVWHWFYLIFFFFVVLIATSFWFGYVTAEDLVGREVAERNLRYFLPTMLLACAFGLIIPSLGEYGRVILHILISVGISVWLLTWFFRKKESGDLLINIGQTLINKFFFWLGLFYASYITLMTWRLSAQISVGIPQSTNLEIQISYLVLCWLMVILALALGLGGLEFRVNGICFMLTFFNWQRVNSYKWEKSQLNVLNVLTIWFKPRFPLLPGFLSTPIPTKHRDVVSQILDEQLPGKKL